MPMNTVAPKVIVIPAKLELTERKRLHCQLRVAAYCRVSTDDEEQLTSYEAQQKLKFHYWLFGHYHDNRNIGNNFVLLYEQIVQAI